MSARLTVLILVGYGTFGGRLGELLADEERVTLLSAGRSLEKLRFFLPVFARKRRQSPSSSIATAIFERNSAR